MSFLLSEGGDQALPDIENVHVSDRPVAQPAQRHSPSSAEEFHRRRAEAEMEKALLARKMSISLLHLELARIHRQRREGLIAETRARLVRTRPFRIDRADKEG